MLVRVRKFRNTQDALSFGRKYRGDKWMISVLHENRTELEKEVNRLQKEGNISGAIYLASGQCQFVREAYEEAEKNEC